jgi:hypothetical protein
MGFDIQICWCDVPAGLLQYESCEIGQVMIDSGWDMIACNGCAPNCVDVAAAGVTPLAGGGVLFYLNFHVSANAKPCMCCDVWFSDIYLYDPEEPLAVCWEDGWVCVEHCDIAGTVRSWECCVDDCGEIYRPKLLENVFVNLRNCEGAVESQYTGPDGSYLFDCLDPAGGECPYCVSLDYCQVHEECIGAFDASLILQYLVCMNDLDACPFMYMRCLVYPQMVAADVNCSGLVTAFDASLILQYVVGLIDILPCPDWWTFFALGTRTVPNCIEECMGEETLDWIGVMKGDVSGCVTCEDRALLAGDKTKVKLGRASHIGDRVEVPIILRGDHEVISAEFGLTYDSRKLTVESVEGAGEASGFVCFYRADGGELSIAMAAAYSFDGDGEVAKITFTKKNRLTPWFRNLVSIEQALLNDGVPETVIAGQIGPLPQRMMALGPVSPNPFVGGTTVRFSTSGDCRVRLAVYDVSGRLVKTLVDATLDAGSHTVLWDGRNAAGERISRGVYFCRMEAESFMSTEKLVLLK